MGGQARAQARAEGEKPAGQAQGNPVDKYPGERTERVILVSDEQKRAEKMLAELAVGHPGPQLELLKGQRVDQDGPAIDKLDIEGAGVLRTSRNQRPFSGSGAWPGPRP